MESAVRQLELDELGETDGPSTVRACEVTALRQTRHGRVVARSEKMHAIIALIERVAPSRCNVLVTGETGTGKELAVGLLHDASPRRNEALVVVNCGAIPENLVESELFGHVRGAFTGAVATRRGHVAEAEGGTLFLDEIGELPLSMQVKLLRLLQQREYTPVGESRTHKADVRVVAATHRNLAAEVAAGRFREDLYHRLNVIHVRLPSLRERPEDIAPLAHAFLRSAADRLGRNDVTGFAPGVLETLTAYKWPGNVRALENALERAVVLAPGHRIELQDLPEEVRGTPSVLPPVSAAPRMRHSAPVRRSCMPTPDTDTDLDAPTSRAALAAPRVPMLSVVARHAEAPAAPALPVATLGSGHGAQIDLRAAVEAFENDLISRALASTHSNKQRAANMLGLKRTTLIEMMKRKGIA
jgi:sigma-54 specific flagellar transcriptional regulator A